jgi:hypothetical protein
MMAATAEQAAAIPGGRAKVILDFELRLMS